MMNADPARVIDEWLIEKNPMFRGKIIHLVIKLQESQLQSFPYDAKRKLSTLFYFKC